MNNYCVYLHKRQSNGTVFYVGSGVKGKREYQRTNRSKGWVDTVNSHGLIVEIFKDGLNKKEAREIEQSLIDSLDNLINKQPVFKIKDIPIEEVTKLYYYCETSPTCIRKISNNKVAGSLKGHSGKFRKTSVLQINCKRYSISRIIYAMHFGLVNDDSFVIDHIDGNTHNNKIENLRLISIEDNSRNRATPVNNKSGIQGIWESATTWNASVSIGGTKINTSFAKKKYGCIQAKQLAINWRLSQLDGTYTDRHLCTSIDESISTSHFSNSHYAEYYIYSDKTKAGSKTIVVKHPEGDSKIKTTFNINKIGSEEVALRMAIELRNKLWNAA